MLSLPDKPGVYLFKDSDRKIIYIGKAISIKKRVSSYFKKYNNSYKNKVLLKEYSELDFILTSNETEALILENNLIKKYKPKYNVLLKDDKSFPFIGVTDEEFPRIVLLRVSSRMKIKYKFGPIVIGKKLNIFLDYLNQKFKLRTCRNFSSRPCLRKDMNFCHAPCCENISKKNYADEIINVLEILKGKIKPIKKSLTVQMEEYANRMDFENAAYCRDLIQVLNHLAIKQNIQLGGNLNFNVCAFYNNGKRISIIMFTYRFGKIVHNQKYCFEIINYKDSLVNFFYNYFKEFSYQITTYVCDEIYKILLPYSEIINTYVYVPKKGKFKEILKTAEKNAFEIISLSEKKMEKIQKIFGLINFPERIECFDISNISGEYNVGSMVVFQYGQKASKEYRRFKIKSVKGPDDFKSMREVIERRLKHEDWNKPDLIIIDGGKGQLSAVSDIVPEEIDLLSIAKKDEIIFDKKFKEFIISKDEEILKLFQNIRDEAHRFAISYYRRLHTNKFLQLEIEKIKGIGKKTVQKILKYFSTYDKLENADYETLKKIIGKKQAKLIFDFLRRENE
ncbi:MAG: excinuclease ABC subunit UvrC [Candidatus Muiribacteriota bacterium]